MKSKTFALISSILASSVLLTFHELPSSASPRLSGGITLADPTSQPNIKQSDSGYVWSRSKEEPFDIKRFGTLLVRMNGVVDLPSTFTTADNQATAYGSIELLHRFDNEDLPPYLSFSLNTKANPMGLSDSPTDNYSATLIAGGIFLHGAPEYFEKSQYIRELRAKGLNFQATSATNFELKMNGQIPQSARQLISDIKSLMQRVQDLKRQLAEYSQQYPNPTQAQLSEIHRRTQEVEALVQKISEMTSLLGMRTSFQCAPEFSRIVKFPIYERSVSSGGSNSSSTGEAAIGVSGDIVVNIKNPTCTVEFKTPFTLETSSAVEVEVISHGYFGARIEGQSSGNIGLSFVDHSGQYPIPAQPSEEEKLFFGKISDISIDSIYRDSNFIQDLENRLSEKLKLIPEAIRSSLIGDGRNGQQVCNTLKQLSLDTVNADIKGICWAATVALPPRPLQPPLPGITLPSPPSLPPEPAPCRRRISPCRGTVLLDFPPGCHATNEVIERACRKYREWKALVDRLNAEYSAAVTNARALHEAHVQSILAKYQAELAAWQSIKDKYDRYVAPGFVQETANQILMQYFFKSIDVKQVARMLLDVAWQANKEVDLLGEFIQKSASQTSIPISISGSGRLAFQSTATLISAKPYVKNTSALLVPEHGNPSLEISNLIDFDGVEHGSLGRLEIVGLNANFIIKVKVREEELLALRDTFERPSPLVIQSEALSGLTNSKPLSFTQSVKYQW